MDKLLQMRRRRGLDRGQLGLSRGGAAQIGKSKSRPVVSRSRRRNGEQESVIGIESATPQKWACCNPTGRRLLGGTSHATRPRGGHTHSQRKAAAKARCGIRHGRSYRDCGMIGIQLGFVVYVFLRGVGFRHERECLRWAPLSRVNDASVVGTNIFIFEFAGRGILLG
jgi:hypothetical protein